MCGFKKKNISLAANHICGDFGTVDQRSTKFATKKICSLQILCVEFKKKKFLHLQIMFLINSPSTLKKIQSKMLSHKNS